MNQEPSPLEDDPLYDLLAEWDERRRLGPEPTPEALCAGDPALRERLRDRIAVLRRLEARLGLDRTPPADGGFAFPDGPPEIPGIVMEAEVGRGAMGVVYRGRQEGMGRLVAVKVILGGAHAAAGERERFRTEAIATARLRHPNIVAIYDSGESLGLPYLVLEYLEGDSLAGRLRGDPQPPRWAAGLARTLAGAVAAAHARGVVHRDLKPRNVLFADDGTPKITDYGLARLLDEDIGHTATGQATGTPSYMAPEQAAGRRDAIGPPTDVYALGAILYELLAGRPPHRGATVLDTLELVRTQAPVPPGRLQPKTPRDLETICLKCLEKEPARRYPGAEALADDLGRFLEGRPILARRTRPLQRGWRWCRRNPAVAGLLALMASMLVGASAISLVAAYHFNRIAEAEGEAREEALRHADDTAAVVRFLVDDMLKSAGPERMQTRAVTVAEVLARADEAIEGRFAGRPTVEATIRQTMGMVYFELGEYEKAKGHLERALALRTDLLGPEHPDALAVAHDLAFVLHNGFRHYDRARQLYERTLTLRRRVLGPEHPDTLTTMLRYAVLLNRGYRNPKEARARLMPVLEARRRVLGPEHPDTLAAGTYLADALWNEGRVPAARALFEEVLAGQRRVLGPEHFQTLWTMDGLARCHLEEDRPDAAEALFDRMLEARLRVLGPEHAMVLTTRYSLAGAYARQGRLEDAEVAYRQLLEAQRRVLGPEHPDTFWTMDGLMLVLSRRHRPDEAVALLDQVLESRKRALGAEHPDTLLAMGDYANLLFDVGRRERARQLDEVRVASYRKVRGPDQPPTLNAMNGLARRLVGAAEPGLGDREIARAVDLATALVEAAPEKGSYWNTLGVARYRAGDWRGSITALERAERLTGGRSFGHNAFFRAMARFRLGELAGARAAFEDAAKWMEKNRPEDPELCRSRAEAATLLGVPCPPGSREQADGPKR